MLTADRDARLAIACCNDVVDEAGQRRDTADEEGRHGPPVAGEFGRVAVDTVEVVHVWHGHVTASHDVVATARETD